MEDFYKVLGVPRTATESELKKCIQETCQALSSRYTSRNKECEERFRQINEAYDTCRIPQNEANMTGNTKRTIEGKQNLVKVRRPESEIRMSVQRWILQIFTKRLNSFLVSTQTAMML